MHQTAKRTFIFIDALDECDPDGIQSQAHFWRGITKWAHAKGVHLNICLSSRHFPTITVGNCPEVIVENHNSLDIATYVEEKFRLSIAAKETQWELLRDKILIKSAGIFLWVVLVVEDVLQKWDDGKGMRFLLNRLEHLPHELENLFSEMFQNLDAEARYLTVRLFQWVVLAARPCRLHEWHHILAFIRDPATQSLGEWRLSGDFTQTDDQLQRQLRSISKGLVEVNTVVDELPRAGFESMSICAGAGSLDLEQGETRVVQLMHESVREFFLQRNGFSFIVQSLDTCPIGWGHLTIMAICLDYIHIKELDALVEAREQTPQSSKSVVSDGTVITSLYSNTDSYHTMSSKKPQSVGIGSKSFNWRRESMEDIPSIAIRNSRSDPGLYSAITRWMSRSHLNVDQTLTRRSARSSSVRDSVTGQSALLEDYPALLPYALNELFTHAQLAEVEGADPSSIINSFHERNTWSRWVTLREDLPRGIELLDYVTHLRLSTWTTSIDGRDARDDQRVELNPQTSSPDEISHDYLDAGSRASSRSNSVASFSSAGSYSKQNRAALALPSPDLRPAVLEIPGKQKGRKTRPRKQI
jgi:hypothetical protein